MMSGGIVAEIARLTAERDAARAKCETLMAERDTALVEVRSQLAEIRVISVDRDSAEDHNGFLREKWQKLEAERDAALADVELQLAAKSVIIQERDVAERERTESRAEVVQVRAERDAALAERDAAELERIVRLNAAQDDVDILKAERDVALAEVAIVIAERDAALTDKHCLRLELERIRAETEGLRADLLANPPEPHQELAIERKRHLELQEDYDRQEVRIAMLEDAAKRAEKVQGKPELQGYLAAIVQLAHTAGGMV